MKNEIWFTARDTYDSELGLNWNKYKDWSKLHHLKELVSLDGSLNGLSFDPDFDSEWQFIITDKQLITPFFNSKDYLIEKTKHLIQFNFLAVIQEPDKNKASLDENFEFIGYDLVEKNGDISALTNCGGFDESFLPKDLNSLGLVTDYFRVKKIQTDLKKYNPNEEHADCYLYEVWRHKTIGRKTKTA